jgi:hypothetical protein
MNLMGPYFSAPTTNESIMVVKISNYAVLTNPDAVYEE